MIYRIAVYRDGKFDHYAAETEMETLRVNADGEVEALSANLNDYNMISAFCWMPVSDTHKVEWGYILPHIGRVYVNDIIGYADHDSSYNEHIGTFAMDVMYWGYNRGQYATGKVIGNIHENPELLGGEE